MRSQFYLVLCVLVVLGLAGCGGDKPDGVNNVPNLDGNYEFTATSQAFPGETSFIGGGLATGITIGDGQVTGTVHVNNTAQNCYRVTDDVPVSGTVSKSGQLTLTSASVNGQVITFTGSASQDGSTISNASYTITGGCANGDHGTVNGFLVQSFTGNYTGSLTNGPSFSLSGTLTQTANSDVHGLFAVTGSVSVPNGTCFTSATVNSDSVAAGTVLFLDLTGNEGSSITFLGTATDGTAKNISGIYNITGGACDGTSGTIMLTRP